MEKVISSNMKYLVFVLFVVECRLKKDFQIVAFSLYFRSRLYFTYKMTKCWIVNKIFVTLHWPEHVRVFFLCVHRKRNVVMLSSSWLCSGVQSVCLWLWLPFCQSSSSLWWASWRLIRYCPYLHFCASLCASLYVAVCIDTRREIQLLMTIRFLDILV